MTTEEIRKRVAGIEEHKTDPESAHGMEDDLWGDVLTAIASGAANPTELAQAALETLKLDFPRWYA